MRGTEKRDFRARVRGAADWRILETEGIGANRK